MGGCNSSRWKGYTKRRTSDSSAKIRIADVSDLMLLGGTYLSDGIRISLLFSSLVEVTFRGVRQDIRCERGRFRLYLVCPGCSTLRSCLYRPSDERLFKCRDCHSLTYATAQEHRKGLDGKLIQRYIASQNWLNKATLTYLDGTPVRPKPEAIDPARSSRFLEAVRLNTQRSIGSHTVRRGDRGITTYTA